MKVTKLAPNKCIEAYLELIYQVSINFRTNGPLPDGQLFDVMDAIHNIPEIIAQNDKWNDAHEFNKIYLEPYDKKWAKNDNDFSLLKTWDSIYNA